MGSIEVSHVDYYLPDGRLLVTDASFRVGAGAAAALVGANGAGKTTLLQLVSGDLQPDSGTVTTIGGVAVMPQFIGSIRNDRARASWNPQTVRDLLLMTAPQALRLVGEELREAERVLESDTGPKAQLRYAQAVVDWGDAGGYVQEATWDICCMAALAQPYDRAADRPIDALSGGEQKRLVLEALLRGDEEVLLLDEPDNYLDVKGKIWLEDQLIATKKTLLFSSHDRELLARVARQIISVEPGTGGSDVWVHGSDFATFQDARQARFDRLDELQRRWQEQRAKLRHMVADLQRYAERSDAMASRYAAAQTRLAKFEEAGPPPEPPRKQNIRVRLRGGRTGVRALVIDGLELIGLMQPFSAEVFYGEHVGILGANGSGKSQFLKLLAGADLPTAGAWRLGARVVPGYFAQTHDHPNLVGRRLTDILWQDHALDRGQAMAALKRYELTRAEQQVFDTLSGGQQARFQVLVLELAGSTMLLLDEPTDNLDLESAEALQAALDTYEGTVLTVTHDRWFAKALDRFLVFGVDGTVREALEPSWDEGKARR